MTKKPSGLIYINGLFLIVAVFLLFLSVLPWTEEQPHRMHGSLPQASKGGSATRAFQFAVLADVHKGWGVFKPIMKDIARDRYAFVVIGGDIVAQNKEDRYRFFFRELAEVRRESPIFFVPGNHDVYNYNGEYSLENFSKYCGPDHYWFSWGNAAFVVVNNSDSRLSNEDFHWYKKSCGWLEAISPIYSYLCTSPPSILEKTRAIAFQKATARNLWR